MSIEFDSKDRTARQRTVVVYTHSLLEPSMTFILSHGEALTRYRAVYAGAHRVPGLALPNERIVTANRGGWSGLAEEFAFRRFGTAGRLARDLRRFRPAIVHAHFGTCGPAALSIAESLAVPLIVTYHGDDASTTREWMRRTWRGREYLRGRQRVMRCASLIIAVSDFVRSQLVERGYPGAKVVTHRNGIDLGNFGGARQSREPVALFVGRLVEKKGCEYLLRALGRLREEGRLVRGVVVGEGPLRPALERVSRQVGAAVEFTGVLAPCKVKEWMGRVSVVVVPSVTAASGETEGLPTVILEAQAMGTPVIATRHAGNAEGVQENRSAVLVHERDVTGLAEAIRFFIGNPRAVESFGEAGRAFMVSSFDLKAQVAGLEQLYDRALLSP